MDAISELLAFVLVALPPGVTKYLRLRQNICLACCASCKTRSGRASGRCHQGDRCNKWETQHSEIRSSRESGVRPALFRTTYSHGTELLFPHPTPSISPWGPALPMALTEPCLSELALPLKPAPNTGTPGDFAKSRIPKCTLHPPAAYLPLSHIPALH